jgi:hypothetical protein
VYPAPTFRRSFLTLEDLAKITLGSWASIKKRYDKKNYKKSPAMWQPSERGGTWAIPR